MSTIAVSFEFEIGDIVYHKAAVHNDHATPRAAVITGQFVERCHGGCVQISYVVSPALDERSRIPEMCLSRTRPPYERSPTRYDTIIDVINEARKAAEDEGPCGESSD